MRRFKMAWTAGVLGVVTATALTACASASGSGGGVSAGGGTPYHLRVYAQTVVDDAPFFIALSQGYFREAGLDVSYVPLAKTTLGLPGLASGSIPIVIGGNYPTMLQADEGIPATGVPGVPAAAGQPAQAPIPAQVISQLRGNVRILVEGYAGGPHVMSVVVPPNSQIKNAAGLAHHKVAVNLLGGIQTLTLNNTLLAEGVNPATVTYVSVPFPKMVAAMLSHEVDAADMLEPFLTQAEVQAGAVEVVDQLQGATGQLPISGVFTTAAFVRAHPQVATAFQSAMLRAQALADANRSMVERELPEYIKATPGSPAINVIAPLINLGNYPASMNPVPLQRTSDLMLSQHLLATRLEVTPLLFMPNTGG